MGTLYELTRQYLSVMELMEEESVYSIECITDTLESIEAEIEDKADAYATIIKELKSDEEKISKEIERLSERKGRISKNITTLKNNLCESMERTGKRKFKTLLFNFSIRKMPLAVHIIDNEKALESKFVRVKEEIDKIAIKEALNNGEYLEFAELRQAEGVQIR